MKINYRTIRKLKKLGYLPRKLGVKRVFKTLLAFLLIISWTLTGFPQIPFTNFPPKIKEAQALIQEISDTADSASPGTTDAVMTNMTITPGAGDYLAVFSTSFESSVAATATVSIYVNGAQITHTEREQFQEGSIVTFETPLATHAWVTVGAGQTVDVRWRSSVAATMVARKRTLNLFPIASADVTQDTATGDTTLDSGTYTQLNAMTRTPGAGNYLLLFSTSADGPSGDKLAFAVFVNGSIIQHTERTQFQEGSIPNTEFVYFIAAEVNPAAGQVVEIRWAEQVNVTGSITAHERTMTLYKTDTANILEVSATGDATEVNTTDALLNAMTQTPGAGDYLAIFSSSFQNNLSTMTIFHSIYVNSVQTTHTERQPIWESSVDNTDIPVVTNGKVSPGASQAVEIMWRASISSENHIAHERTFILLKEPSAAATLTQNDFEFWVDNDALTPAAIWGNPDIAENTALNALPPSNDPIDPADEIRIRMNISVTVATLAVSTEDFILQYKEAQDCTDAAAWTDVDAAAGAGTWRFATSTVTDNTTLTTLLVSTSDVAGRYNKSDPTSTNPNAVTAGQEFEWDWHVEYNGTAAAKTYCFRMVKNPVAALDAYNTDSYPRVDTRPGTADLMRHGNFFTTGVERGFFWAD